jgi:hypothetical protein
MKTLRQLLLATCLVLTLGVAAFAGDVETPGSPVPPPPPPAPAPGPDTQSQAPGDSLLDSLTLGLLSELF